MMMPLIRSDGVGRGQWRARHRWHESLITDAQFAIMDFLDARLNDDGEEVSSSEIAAETGVKDVSNKLFSLAMKGLVAIEKRPHVVKKGSQIVVTAMIDNYGDLVKPLFPRHGC